MNRRGRNAGKLIDRDTSLLKEAKEEYKYLYDKNCIRSGVNKFWLLSLQMRTLLVILSVDRLLEGNIPIHKFYRIAGYDSYILRTKLKQVAVPDFKLEAIIEICDFIGIGFFELKKRVLTDLMVTNGEQNEKIYEKCNKQYSVN